MRRKFSDAFKQQVLAEHVQGRLSLSEIARKYDIEVRLLKSWMNERAASLNGRESGIPMTGEHLQK
ncbi:MAG: transposase [Bacteroidia bacterium]|jgi:transposase-like protein|nr:transposase [Bacteroidia bacterium]MBP6009886.1 transposase [Bacteroidia bacterium]MBP7269453.1 transposase [Bacteroidia bacterium]MBP7436167.1 transposase [Bacteroidia bacterium]MBP7771506.1 transposase [Bacteroidia bacterium]